VIKADLKNWERILDFVFGSEDPPAVSALAIPSVEMNGSLKALGRLSRAFRNGPSGDRVVVLNSSSRSQLHFSNPLQ